MSGASTIRDGRPGLFGSAGQSRTDVLSGAGTLSLNPQQDGQIVIANASHTVNLPALADCGPGWGCTIINTDMANTVTVDPDGTEQINGGATLPITGTDFQGAFITNDGSQWVAVVAP